MSELIAASFVNPFQGLKQIGLNLTAKALNNPFQGSIFTKRSRYRDRYPKKKRCHTCLMPYRRSFPNQYPQENQKASHLRHRRRSTLLV